MLSYKSERYEHHQNVIDQNDDIMLTHVALGQ
jgi:hypothetical protein